MHAAGQTRTSFDKTMSFNQTKRFILFIFSKWNSSLLLSFSLSLLQSFNRPSLANLHNQIVKLSRKFIKLRVALHPIVKMCLALNTILKKESPKCKLLKIASNDQQMVVEEAEWNDFSLVGEFEKSDWIASFWYYLMYLQNRGLSDNQLTGSIPTQLGNLQNLKKL